MEQENVVVHRDLDALKDGKVIALVPQGISMLPFIKGGVDQVYLLKKDRVAVGDIVLVEYHGKHILHRVYAVDGEKITLMGDGNLEGTEQVAADEVIGTVVDIVHNGRHLKPKKAWLWRHLLPMRRYLLKIHRKLSCG
jgi:SOS-response transcriptional repressor LexA